MSGIPPALQAYATEAIRQQAYKRAAGAKLREFEEACRESREAAKRAMDAAGVEAVALPEQGVALRRVRREAPGSLTLRRLEEYTSKLVTAEEAAALAALAREVGGEAAERRAREAEREAQRREAERRREEREARAAEREREREARAARAAERREAAEAKREAKRRAGEARARLEAAMERAM